MYKLVCALAVLGLFISTSVFGAVNVNTASADELAELSGIGSVKSQAIVDYRDNNGKYDSLDQLTEVDGIGDKTLADLREQATVGQPDQSGGKNTDDADDSDASDSSDSSDSDSADQDSSD